MSTWMPSMRRSNSATIPRSGSRPVAVGESGARGVVAAASYEARAFGVRSAMPSVTTVRKCPDLVFVPPRFDVYREVSDRIRAIFADYTDLIEPLSLDEAYLDVTEDIRGLGTAAAIAEEIRSRIKADTGLTASAGVSYNKFIAKLASDHNKPDGICIITPRRGAVFVQSLPVKRFHGVGPVTAQKMERLGSSRAQTFTARTSRSCRRTSVAMQTISTAQHAASITAPCASTAPPSRSARNGRSRQT
jgi:DNA polymerase-4